MRKEEKESNAFFIQQKVKYRQEEASYGKQIFNQYIAKNNNQNLIKRMFQTLNSDWLHIEESFIEQNNKVEVLKSKADYQQGDIIMEIRGSIINRRKLQKRISEEPKIKEAILRVHCLVWGQQEDQILIPQGLARKLLNAGHSNANFVKENKQECNCFIEYEMGAKYLIEAKRQIKAGERLILELKSLQRFLYSI